MKRLITDREKLFVNHISEEELVTKTCKEHSKFNNNNNQVWYWRRYRRTDQWDRIENTEIDPHKDGQLI